MIKSMKSIFMCQRLYPRILLYHTIGSFDSFMSISIQAFKTQMTFLKEHKYRVYGLNEAFHVFCQGKEFEKKSVIITFDDGYVDNFTVAFPVLKLYGFSATVFINTDYIGKDSSWNHHSAFVQPLLDKEQICQMSQEGIDFGSHGTTHHNLMKLDDIALKEQLQRSRNVLEDIIQRKVTTFSYPYGLFNERVKSVVREYFDLALSVRDGTDDWQKDIFALNRVSMKGSRQIENMIKPGLCNKR